MRHTRPLPFTAYRNSELFANHWIERRLPLEPEWIAMRGSAQACLDQIRELWKQEGELLPTHGESALEDAWIRPILRALGWHFTPDKHLAGNEPDYALFLTDEARRQAHKLGKSNPEYWTHATVAGEAKSWTTNLDKRVTSGDREFPPQQIERYMDRTRLDWGLLTNGRLWRLIPRERNRNQPRFETYFELDIERLLRRPDRGLFRDRSALDEFLPWYLLATPTAFITPAGQTSLINRALSGSTAYRVKVGDELREQVFEALRLCVEGFLSHSPNGLDPEADIEACRTNAFTLLFRLLFILFAEDRGLLPYARNRPYTDNRSLTRHHEILRQHAAGKTLTATGTGAYQHWTSLFDLIDAGHATYGVQPYNGGLFEPDEHPFLVKYAIGDVYAQAVLDNLRRATDPQSRHAERVNVDYRDLAIQHLGNIYEGLLELRPRYAREAMVVVRKTGKAVEKTIPQSQEPPEGFEPTEKTHRAGEVYLETDKGERRASGSYYTPDHIVDYIVAGTLGPLCAAIDTRLGAEIAKLEEDRKRARNGKREAIDKDLQRLRTEYDDRVLRLTVLDPAMGSGHFLIAACQFLAADIATNPRTADPAEPDTTDAENSDESTLLFWKRRVVERCIYGVDKNPIAVELAKLALWLETVASNQPLSFLDHHLRHGDSLIGAKIDMLGRLPDRNVPEGGVFESTIAQRLPVLLKPLEEIQSRPSATIQDVKAKEALYRRAFEPVHRPFVQVANLWLSVFFTPEGEREVSTQQYAAALEALGQAKFKALAHEPWFTTAENRVTAPGVDGFHWELEFPEVYLAPERTRAGRTGFDAIIGNPPYDVLAEKELTEGRPVDEAARIRQHLSSLKGFIEATTIYDPARRGKNNLYKLFICRALDLLANDGRFGFIVPMAVLGDDQAADIRKAMLAAGALTAVEAFPQKDDPEQRVFREAKLSTAVFTMVKTNNPSLRTAAFPARQHPAARIDDNSPGLRLTAGEIPSYDPENLGIVSCSQDDWNLAVRLMASGRMARLGQFAQFSQGEVNETVARAAGWLASASTAGRVVQRGASICLYVLRPASQGEDLYLNVSRFLEGKGEDTKAFHHRHARVALQESSPQNNFRRIIASLVPAGEFCNHKINYVPEPASRLPLQVLLALLNSNLADWYFRLGSTNAAVSHYQLHNLPCPVFAESADAGDARLRTTALGAIKAGRMDDAFGALRPALARPPFPKAVADVLVDLVKRIIRVEKARGTIARSDRSVLATEAQPLQALIDRIIYTMAGLTNAEAAALERRLATML